MILVRSYLQRAREIQQEITAHRRYLHENAETGFDLPATTRYISDQLTKMHLEPVHICQSGITATIEGGRPGPVILLRADTDAVPMEEVNNLPFKSKTGNAHTCGHDMHAAMLLGAAQLLQEQQGQLAGTIKLAFQPAEESLAGAKAMIKAGLLENPTVDVALSLHVSPEHPLGVICTGSGFITASCDSFKITINGKSAQGSSPEDSIDPINIGVHIYQAFQELIARETPPRQAAVLTFGQFSSGFTNNIIPSSAVLQGTMRTHDARLRSRLLTRMRDVIDHGAKMFSASSQFEITQSAPSVFNDPVILEEMLGCIREMDHPFLIDESLAFSPSEDFAYFTEKVPSAYFMVGAAVDGNEHSYHHPNILFNEDALPLGASIYAQCAADWLERATEFDSLN